MGPISLERGRGDVSPRWYVIADPAEGAEPIAGPRAARTDDDKRVRPTGDEHIEDFREAE